MDLNRRVCVRILFILPLLPLVGTATVLPGPVQRTALKLNCTNDYDELMFCQLEVKNCAGYSLTLRSNEGYGEKNCTFVQRDPGQCHCSFQIMLVLGETYTATVWKDGKSVENKNFSVRESLKPKTPTISSVDKSNGNFQVMWRSHMNGFINDELTAEVTYYKRGDTKKISKFVTPATVEGQQYYEINGKDLDPNSVYVVIVKSFFSGSGKLSDSSTEFEFNTSASHDSLLLHIVVGLSIAAVIFSAALYGTYVKFKTNWWDVVSKTSNPDFLNFYPSKQKVLKPEPSVTSYVCVEPITPDDGKQWSKPSLTDTSSGSLQESSGLSTGSSCLNYMNTGPPAAVDAIPDTTKAVQNALGEIFPNISLTPPLTITPFSAPYSPCRVKANDTNSGSSVFENKPHPIHVPSCPFQIMANNLKFQVQAEMLCDSEYHTSKTDAVSCPDHQVPACPVPAEQDVVLPPMVSSFMPTDMSYQHYNADSGRFSFAEDSSLSSISSSTNTTDSSDLMSRAEAGFESSDEIVLDKTKQTEEATTCDENPCMPTGPHSFLSVDDDYKAFPSQAREPSVLVLKQIHDEHKEHSDKYGKDLLTKTPQSIFSPVSSGFINNVQDGLQIPFYSLSADCSVPLLTDSGYQSV